MPTNSSRVALNQDWRQDYRQSSASELGSEMGRGMVIEEVAPGKEGYGRAESRYGDEKSTLDDPKYSVIPPNSPALNEKGDFPPLPFTPRDAPAVVISRTNRLAWIDGLRGIASIIIFTHHFSDYTWIDRYPDVLADGSIEGFLRLVESFLACSITDDSR